LNTLFQFLKCSVAPEDKQTDIFNTMITNQLRSFTNQLSLIIVVYAQNLLNYDNQPGDDTTKGYLIKMYLPGCSRFY